jgi:glucokinase
MIGSKKSKKILVADIGGTNARFAMAIFEGKATSPSPSPKIESFQAYSCGEYHDPMELVQQYLSKYSDTHFDSVCLAVAGVTNDNTAYLTNLGWTVDGNLIATRFGLSNVVVTNDFAALARSATALGPAQLLTLHSGDRNPTGPISVMGPGTGFGIAQVVRSQSRSIVIPTEGGHCSFVPSGTLETQVWNAVRDSLGRVTIETFMSGIGMLRIYRAVCGLHNVAPLNYEPSTISQRALEQHDKICIETLSVFCGILGSVASDKALSHGATGGIYLGGGILPKIADFVTQSDLVERFLDKPPLEDFVAKIPIHMIIDPHAALVGAALFALDTQGT